MRSSTPRSRERHAASPRSSPQGSGAALDRRAAGGPLASIRRGRRARDHRRRASSGAPRSACRSIAARTSTLATSPCAAGSRLTTVARTIADLRRGRDSSSDCTNVMYEARTWACSISTSSRCAARLNGRQSTRCSRRRSRRTSRAAPAVKRGSEDAFHALGRGKWPRPSALVKVLGEERRRALAAAQAGREIDGRGTTVRGRSAVTGASASCGPRATRPALLTRSRAATRVRRRRRSAAMTHRSWTTPRRVAHTDLSCNAWSTPRSASRPPDLFRSLAAVTG